MRTLLDTHTWVWWVTEDRRLSKRAQSAIARSQRAGDVWVSLISIWELAKKIEKNQMVLDRPVDQWLDAATTMTGLHLADLTRPILVESCQLPQPFHGDPADQIIVATARHENAVLVTRDGRMRGYAYVRSLW
jgi:PIN domain nuclease of toxin-antitoxin system